MGICESCMEKEEDTKVPIAVDDEVVTPLSTQANKEVKSASKDVDSQEYRLSILAEAQRKFLNANGRPPVVSYEKLNELRGKIGSVVIDDSIIDPNPLHEKKNIKPHSMDQMYQVLSEAIPIKEAYDTLADEMAALVTKHTSKLDQEATDAVQPLTVRPPIVVV